MSTWLAFASHAIPPSLVTAPTVKRYALTVGLVLKARRALWGKGKPQKTHPSICVSLKGCGTDTPVQSHMAELKIACQPKYYRLTANGENAEAAIVHLRI